jgi:hypothetical protein
MKITSLGIEGDAISDRRHLQRRELVQAVGQLHQRIQDLHANDEEQRRRRVALAQPSCMADASARVTGLVGMDRQKTGLHGKRLKGHLIAQ